MKEIKINSNITKDEINWFLQQLEDCKKLKEYEVHVSKNIIMIATELLDNIYKYQQKNDNISSYAKLKIELNNISFIASNTIMKSDYLSLQSRLKRLSSYSLNDLNNEMFRNLNSKNDLEKDGCGLGMLLIFKRNLNNINYKFERLDENFYIFTIIIYISQIYNNYGKPFNRTNNYIT